jgi:hypothetical protein
MKCKYCGSQTPRRDLGVCELCFDIQDLVRRGAVPHAIATIVNELSPRVELTVKVKK